MTAKIKPKPQWAKSKPAPIDAAIFAVEHEVEVQETAIECKVLAS